VEIIAIKAETQTRPTLDSALFEEIYLTIVILTDIVILSKAKNLSGNAKSRFFALLRMTRQKRP